MEIVAEIHVGRRRLLRGCLQSGMRVESGHNRQPAGVRNPEDSNAAIVARYVLEQPLDSVVRVGALVDGFWIALVARTAQHHESPVRLVSSPNVLEYKNV